MSILTQLRQAEKDRTRFKEIGRTATKSYQELQPKYSQAVQAAKNYQSTLTRDYNQYIQSRNQAVDSYNQQLQQRYQTYQGAVQQGSGLERSYQAAQQELKRLEGVRDAAAQQANQLYGTYSSKYSAATRTGQQQYESSLTNYRTQISNLQQEAEGYSSNIAALTKDIQARERTIYSNQSVANLFANSAEIGGRYVILNPKSERLSNSRNKIYRVYTDAQNRYGGAREYQPGNIGILKGLARDLGQVTDSGVGSLTEAIKSQSDRGTMTFSDAVYESYRRGATDYSTYEDVANRAKTYAGYVQTAIDRITQGQAEIDNFRTGIRNNEQRIAGLTTQISGVNTDLENLLKDTGYVTRFAQQQSAGALSNYQNYLRSTYNPSVASYNQYGAQTYNPAAQAYQDFMGSGQVQSALQSYQSLAQDTGYADRASSQAKQVYDASAQRYQDLQTSYQQLEQPLGQYATEMKDASEQIKQLNLQIPGLQRSLKVEQDPRKRETRIGYGRSLMTSGTKRRSSVR